MAGMYPDDQELNIYGEPVTWPGMDPDTGKFTNGDFSDPLKKPSFMPAESINLILDNLSSLITALGGAPNNYDTNQLAKLFSTIAAGGKVVIRDGDGYIHSITPSINDISDKAATTQFVNNFDKPPLWMPFPLFDDDLLEDGMLVCNGATYYWDYPEANDPRFTRFLTKYTANYGASIDIDGDGNRFRLPDFAGLTIIGAGTNTFVDIKDKNGVSQDPKIYYNGGTIGDFVGDAFRNVSGLIGRTIEYTPQDPFYGTYEGNHIGGSAWRAYKTSMDLSRSVPTANFNRSASVPVIWIYRIK